MIQMLQEHFISEVGRCNNIDNTEVPYSKWEEIAKQVSLYGPSKTADEWRKVKRFFALHSFFLIVFYIVVQLHKTKSEE